MRPKPSTHEAFLALTLISSNILSWFDALNEQAKFEKIKQHSTTILKLSSAKKIVRLTVGVDFFQELNPGV